MKPRKAFHADEELFEALDRYCRSFEHRVDESDVLRAALTAFLASKGFWPPK